MIYVKKKIKYLERYQLHCGSYILQFHAVDDGAILDSTFRDFTYPPPDGYDRIMFEKSIL